MTSGIGFWYDRRRQRFWRITEHATDAVTFPVRFRAKAVASLHPVTDRESIVREVARQGFIRIRHIKHHLGFEFHGDPQSALQVLQRFVKRHEIGPSTTITISDFSTDSSLFLVIGQTIGRSAKELGFPQPQDRL